MSIFLAVFIGVLFGFVLQKMGATSPKNMINMLRLRDITEMKIILFAIGVSSLTIFLLLSLGILDGSAFHIKSAYIGVIVGGAIFGLGWALSGYCPGTSIVAVGSGRKDAIAFVLGGLVGAFIFMMIYSFIKDGVLFEKLFGGKATLVMTSNEKVVAILPDMSALIVSGVLSVSFIAIAFLLPKKIV
jgi:uncharacterized membrane protein YedE/YeeE